jgi:hypothetical protein
MNKADQDATLRTHWKQLTDPRFIGAYALPEGQDITVTIRHVQKETVTMMGGKKEDHSLMYLAGGHKPMILNVTNQKTLEKLYGPYIEDWAGKAITLYASTTKLGNEMVECLRIRAKIPPAAKEALAPGRFTKALAGVRAGTFAAATLRDKFALTTDQQTALADAESERAA